MQENFTHNTQKENNKEKQRKMHNFILEFSWIM